MDAVGTPAAHPVRGLELTSDFNLHAERHTVVSEERWFSAGNDQVTLDYRDSARFESHVTYDARGRMALSMPSDWHEKGRPAPGLPNLPQPRPLEFAVRPQRPTPPPLPDPMDPKDELDINEDNHLSVKQRMTLLLLKKFFGFDAELFDPRELQEAQESGEKAAEEVREATQRRPARESNTWVDAGVRRTIEVKEQVEFEAQLTARVDDGQGGTVEQKVSVKLRTSREFFQQEEATLQAGNRPKKDPLVLDLTGEGIDLTGVEDGTVFDLDADGVAERAATVRGGTGLLWMDRNGNGQLDNGSELFGDFDGAADGFDALAALDANGDGRVNMNDASFDQLRVRLNNGGQTQDLSMEQAGVASLELQNQKLPASLGESASIDAVGVFQRTDGSLGMMADVLLAYDA